MDYKCNLLLPGAPKSGTSSLHVALEQHPEICMSRPKEPWFFFGDRFKGGSTQHNSLFSHSDSDSLIFGESSQGYFADAQSMKRIKESLEKPKIILLLRDPVERALSQYRYDFRRGVETDPLEKALSDRGDNPALVWDDRISFYRNVGGYCALSGYSRIVPEWQTLFGAENILLLKAEDFHDDPAAVLARCNRFLGLRHVAHNSQADNGTVRNATSGTKRKVMPGPIKAAARLVPSGFKSSSLYRRLRGGVLRGITPPSPTTPSPATLQRMRETLAADIAFHQSLSHA
ncbi:hypothetical protein ROE7235_02284 [Roseibaca ekhonensis]|uniref:Sulfotransferase domain-containing protein n=1 Tax=Roseinatronobacter ekhonensis TaxID=254356 RepID=A0A3B0MA29_9RHOB|nr:hypothetical protein ROE7235_02284 [Roseibaca ekhonensis]